MDKFMLKTLLRAAINAVPNDLEFKIQFNESGALIIFSTSDGKNEKIEINKKNYEKKTKLKDFLNSIFKIM